MRYSFLSLALVLAGCAEVSVPPSREQISDRFLSNNSEAEHAIVGETYKSRFSGKLFLVLLDDKTHGAVRDGRSLWALSEEISYSPGDGSGVITVPKGFVTDLASIPRPVWALLPPDGPWTKAAVVHDYLYHTRGTGVWKGHPRTITHSGDYTRADADWILRDAMEDRGVDIWRRNIIYDAVRLGGGGGWGH